MDKEKDKICLECGRKFKTDDNRIKYCSDGCRRSAAIEKVKVCQKNKHKEARVIKTCCICGKEFIDTTKNHGKNTCSQKCKQEKQSENLEKWKTENPESYKKSQKKSIARKKRMGYWKKYYRKKGLLTKIMLK